MGMRGMRTSRILIHLGLILVVLLSVVLSWFIWTNPARYEKTKQQSSRNSTVIQNEQSNKSIGDIYLPTQVIYHQTDTNTHLINNTNVSLTDSIRSAIEKWHLRGVTRESVDSRKAYEKLIARDETVMLKYPDSVTSGILNDAFDQKTQFSGKFSRIVFSVSKRNEVYLLNDTNYAIYKVRTTNQNLAQIKELLSGNVQRFAVKETLINHRLMTNYENEVKVPEYSYLVNKQTAAYFVSTLMDSDNASSVTTKEQKGKTIYSDSNSKRMTINNKRGTVFYEDLAGQQSYHEGTSKALSQSFTVLKRMEVPLDNMRYYRYDSEKNSVIYRSYVEGFPIFNQTDYGTVEVQITGARTKQIDFSLYSLQIPVPTGKERTTLPSTQTILNQLEATGYKLSDISNIEIGYQWTANPSSDLVVNLTPTWYVNYKNQWISYQKLIEQQP